MPDGIVFDIQRFSLHDGPGIRTTVFLKGCALRCFWCHNPEGLRAAPEVQYAPELCLGAGDCARVCPQGAHAFGDAGHIFRRAVCTACGECVAVCAAQALTLTGRRMTPEAVLAEVLPDRPFYARSGGGVTLSGGDPLVQRAFTAAVLARCRGEGISTALETAAHCPWDHLAGLLPHVDLVMMDLKHMDDAAHRAATGVGNGTILANARRLAEAGVPLVFRVPVIPGINDEAANISTTAEFVRSVTEAGRERGHYPDTGPILELLPFHRLASQKYRRLCLPERGADIRPPGRDHMMALVALAGAAGIPVRCR